MPNILYLNQFKTTTLSVVGGIDNSQTTGIVIQSVSGLDTTKPGIACLTYTDPLDLDNAEYIEYTAINSTTKTFTGVTRGSEGYSAKSHDNGVTVAFPVSESHINRLADAVSIGGDATNPITGVLDEDTFSSNSATKVPTQQSVKAYVDAQSPPQSLYENLLINGNMDISQRATTFVAGANNDDVYTLDRWNLLSDGNDVFDVSQESVTDLPGSSYAIKLDVETSARGGIIQFIESKDAIKFRGQTVSLSFKVKSANISAIRAGVLSWDGTADTLTSDVVGTWADTPTPVANWTFENTPADLTVTSSWTTVTIEGIVLDTVGMNNLGVFIWTPNAETIGNIVYISQIKVNQGSTATSFMPKSVNEELILCKRYFERISENTTNISYLMSTGLSTTVAAGVLIYKVEKRDNATITTSATAGDFQLRGGVVTSALTSFGTPSGGKNSAVILPTVSGGGLIAGDAYFLRNTSSNVTYFDISAEL